MPIESEIIRQKASTATEERHEKKNQKQKMRHMCAGTRTPSTHIVQHNPVKTINHVACWNSI